MKVVNLKVIKKLKKNKFTTGGRRKETPRSALRKKI